MLLPLLAIMIVSSMTLNFSMHSDRVTVVTHPGMCIPNFYKPLVFSRQSHAKETATQRWDSFNIVWGVKLHLMTVHIVPCGKFHRIGGAPPETFPNDAPEEVGGDRKSFDSLIRKLGLI